MFSLCSLLFFWPFTHDFEHHTSEVGSDCADTDQKKDPRHDLVKGGRPSFSHTLGAISPQKDQVADPWEPERDEGGTHSARKLKHCAQIRYKNREDQDEYVDDKRDNILHLHG